MKPGSSLGLPVRLTAFMVILIASSLVLADCQSYPPPQRLPPAVKIPKVPEKTIERKGPGLVLYHGPTPKFTCDMDKGSMSLAAKRSLEFLSKVDRDAKFNYGDKEVTVDRMEATIKRLEHVYREEEDPTKRARIIRKEFDIYIRPETKGPATTLITGYYQPELEVRRKPDAKFRYPIYSKPEDLVRVDLGLFPGSMEEKRISGRVVEGALLPYYDRREIDGQGALNGKGLELAWAEDRMDIFILHVQGSGVLRFQDGEEKFANFAAVNGRQYRSIGKFLIEEGKVPREKMSLSALRGWFRDHPEDLDRVLFVNPSYVFFRLMEEGPYGSLGGLLVEGRSAAFDHAVFPKGAPAWFTAKLPYASGGKALGAKNVGRFIFNHDQGGAIKGLGRMDLFYGQGRDAEAAAGMTKHMGKVYFLLLKDKTYLAMKAQVRR